MQVLCDMANAVLDGETGYLLGYIHLIHWSQFREAWGKSYGKKLGLLSYIMPIQVNGMNTIVFIYKQDIPSNQFKHFTNGKKID